MDEEQTADATPIIPELPHDPEDYVAVVVSYYSRSDTTKLGKRQHIYRTPRLLDLIWHVRESLQYCHFQDIFLSGRLKREYSMADFARALSYIEVVQSERKTPADLPSVTIIHHDYAAYYDQMIKGTRHAYGYPPGAGYEVDLEKDLAEGGQPRIPKPA